MDFALPLQKLCQFEARRLVLLVGLIASVLLIQSFTFPDGNVFSSLYSPGKALVPQASILTDGNSSSKSEMVGSHSSSNDSTSNDLSLVPGVESNADASDMEKETQHEDVKTGKDEGLEVNLETEKDGSLDNAFVLEEDNPDSKPDDLNKTSESQKIGNQQNVSTIVNTKEPEKLSPIEQVLPSNKDSPINVPEQDNGSQSEKSLSGGTSSLSPLVTSSPILPVTNLTSSTSQSSISMISVNSNATLTGNEVPTPISQERQGSPSNNSLTVNSTASTENYNEEALLPSVRSISDMNKLLIQSRTSPSSMIPRWPSARDQEILSAKLQIEMAPIVTSDPVLYAPLFRNISMFKRSYELMERVLKVYIYKEGSRPIFHQPVLKGIYASEGWFMKLMEGNKQFVVKDPKQAHLFYMPFSTRMLQVNMYVPDSHSHKNLVEYLKRYLDGIVAKYPYWNRTGGSDHFLVGCHDWAPAETTEYMSNCIRALCNSDINIGFTIGKDVSLAETLIHTEKDPLRYLGGEPPKKRKTLAFFAGRMHGYFRPILLQYWQDKDPDMKIFGKMGRGKKDKANYLNYMKTSKYCICAKGFEVNSPRVVEAIFYECVPVIISDNFVPPFFEILNWESFAVFIAEKDVPRLKEILLSIPEKKYLEMQMRVKKVQQHFLWHPKPVKYDIFHMILHSIWFNRVFQLTTAR